MKKHILVIALSLVSLVTLSAHAESNFVVGTGTAAAKLDFRVIVPRILFLGVGTGATGTALTNNTTVDRLDFDLSATAATIGNGTAIAPTANTGGFTGTGTPIPVRVRGNNGQIVLTSTNSGDLVSGSDTIPFSEIISTSSSSDLDVPAASGGSTNPVFNAGSTKVTSRSANWTFTYANTLTPAAGEYNGTVTYTASMP